MVFYFILLFIFGAIIGSFLNVLIYRLPRKESIVFPGSHCVNCGHELGVWDLIPLFSQLALGSKCRYCKKEISPRYFLVELATAVVFCAVYVRFMVYEQNSWPVFISFLLLSGMLIVVTFIDLDHKIIPDKITYPGMAAGLVFAILARNFLPSVFGLLLGGGIFYLIAIVSKGGMGGGDVKLAAMLGAFLGWKLILVNVFLSFLFGGAVAAILLILKIKGRKDYVPFGPYLALAGLLTMFWGPQILSFYLNFKLFK